MMAFEALICGRIGMKAVYSRWWGWTGDSPGGGVPAPSRGHVKGAGHSGTSQGSPASAE